MNDIEYTDTTLVNKGHSLSLYYPARNEIIRLTLKTPIGNKDDVVLASSRYFVLEGASPVTGNFSELDFNIMDLVPKAHNLI